jgi:hypothetical protein
MLEPGLAWSLFGLIDDPGLAWSAFLGLIDDPGFDLSLLLIEVIVISLYIYTILVKTSN